MSAKDVALLGLELAFGNLVELVRVDRAGKALERAFAVHVLDRDAGAIGLTGRSAALVAVLEELEREAAEETIPRLNVLDRKRLDVERKVEGNEHPRPLYATR